MSIIKFKMMGFDVQVFLEQGEASLSKNGETEYIDVDDVKGLIPIHNTIIDIREREEKNE